MWGVGLCIGVWLLFFYIDNIFDGFVVWYIWCKGSIRVVLVEFVFVVFEFWEVGVVVGCCDEVVGCCGWCWFVVCVVLIVGVDYFWVGVV